MINEKTLSVGNSIATRILLVVLVSYLLIASVVSIGQLGANFRYQKANIITDLEDIGMAFEEGLAVNLWNLDEEALKASVEGILRIPAVVGVKIDNAELATIAVGGMIAERDSTGAFELRVNLSGLSDKESIHESMSSQSALFMHHFPIIHNVNGRDTLLGEGTVFSSNSIIYHRMKIEFVMVVVTVGVTLLVFFLVLLWTVNRYLRQPLGILTRATSSISLENLNEFRVDTGTSRRDEIKILEESFNRMIRNLHQSIVHREKAEEAHEKLQEQLTQAQKMESIGRLAGGVAHDFNNMLSVIMGHAELALDDLPENSSLRTDLEEIQVAAKRSVDLTHKLLAFARKQTIAPRILDLNETITSMVKMLLRLIGEDIDLVWKPGDELESVRIDPGQVDQLLVNLVVNARDAIGHKVGKVTIETGHATFENDFCATHAGFVPGDYVILAVSDDGHGMDEETRAKIFEPFFTTKGVGKGTGLGLATVYGIVKQNSGFINVYSEPDQGATFRIYLPAHKAAQTGRTANKEAVIQTVQGDKTILVVEDESTILKITQNMLERLGYTVMTAISPGEAIQLAQEYTDEIHLLLTDVVMPEMNGRDLAGKLIGLYPDIKLLFMSGYTANVITHHGVLEKDTHFIEKPFSMTDLAAKVSESLDQG